MSSKACAAGGSFLPPTAPKERKRSVAALFNQYAAHALGGAPEETATKERRAPQRVERSTPLLQSGPEDTRLRSRFIVRTLESERHSHGVCAFARGLRKLDFSEKLTIHTRNALLAVQRVYGVCDRRGVSLNRHVKGMARLPRGCDLFRVGRGSSYVYGCM